MRSTFAVKLALGLAAICGAGGVAGIGLANYVTSGTFDFYRQQRVTQWQPTLPAQPAALQSTDLAFASDRPNAQQSIAPDEELASLNP